MTRASGHRRWRLSGLGGLAAVAILGSGVWAQGASPGPSSSGPASTHSGLALGPSQLVATLHQVNQMEISAGHMAQQNGSMPAVRDFGQTLVRDHQAADDQLTMYASSKGISLNDVPMTFRKQQEGLQAKMDKLRTMSGAPFDHAFALDMAKAHANVIAMINASRPAVKDEGLVVLLDGLVPTLRKHRQMAENILNGNAGTASHAAASGGTAQGRRGPSR